MGLDMIWGISKLNQSEIYRVLSQSHLFKNIFEVYHEVLMNKLLVSIMHCIILAMYSNCNININIYFHNKLRELRP